MAKIKIYGDIDSASIFFLNSTVDPKPMGTIVASLKSDEDRIVVQRNDRFESDGVTFRTLFRRLNPSRVQNKQGVELVGTLGYTTQEVIDYINGQSNLQGNQGGDGSGTDMIGLDVCFKLDDTSTSVMIDTGHEFGVNTIKAVENNGVINIVSELGSLVHFTNLEVGRVCGHDGNIVAGGINDVINYLNELFTVGAFQSVVITDPEATTIADVGGIDAGGYVTGANAEDPLGDDVYVNNGNNSLAGLLTTETISKLGEYFTFDIRNEGQIGFGLVHTQDSFDNDKWSGSSYYADPSKFATQNSAHFGFQFSHWFHQTPNGSWTNYGGNTAYVMGPAWYDSNNQFEARDEWLNGDPIKIKVGIDNNGYIAIYSLADNGTDWKLHARTSYVLPEGGEYRLGIKSANSTPRVATAPKVHLLPVTAPTMYFRYIESPDGNFEYPLFATTEEAEYYDTENGGSGTYHSHVYVDDPTGTTWYMPDTNAVMNGTSAPAADLSLGQAGNYTEITSLTNADQIPPAFSSGGVSTLFVDELSSVNYQTQPMDTAYVTTFTGLPVGLIGNAGTVNGTAPEVTGDNVANPSDTYTVTVTRTNSYGSSTGTLSIIVANLTVPVTVPSGFTLTSGSMADADTLDSGSTLTLDDTLASGKRMIVSKSWVETNVLPNITGSLEKAYIGVPSPSANWSNNADLHIDFDAVMRWEGQSGSAHKSTLADGSDTVARSENSIGSTTNAYYNYAIQWDGTDLVVMADTDANKLANTYDYTQMDRYSAYENYTEQSGALPLVFATKSGGQMDVTMTGITFSDIPAQPVTNLTSWSKALDFSGSSERAQQVGSNTNYMPIGVDGLSVTASSPSISGNTSGHIYSRPFATSIVFRADGNNSNQHIWNQGEGAGSSDDNIYLRLAADSQLYFGWGRDGALNECALGSINTNKWYGVYIASNGARFSGSDATAANLASAFDIRITNENINWVNPTYNYSIAANWQTTGGRMDRSVTGNFTIGGRGSNRNFHGKVASFVSTTLRINQPMPVDAEIGMMITDPVKWLQDYKVGNPYRVAYGQAEATFQLYSYITNAAFATQVWLMGDGSNDSYSNMIRNQVYASDQNYTKLNLISMVSNDIQTVNINGLT